MIERDGAVLLDARRACSEHAKTLLPEFGLHRWAALEAATFGAVNSLGLLRGRVSQSTVDSAGIAAIAGGLDRDTGTYRPGLYPVAALRDAGEESLGPLFRIITWAHVTEVISEFWWPDYHVETAAIAAMFGIQGPGERLMIAYGPDPGRVRHEADLSAEYTMAKARAVLCAMIDELTGERTSNDDFWIDALLPGWIEDFQAGQDEMDDVLTSLPDGYPLAPGVAEAREGQEVDHQPPPRMNASTVGDVEGAWGLCEEGFSLVDEHPSEDDPLYEDIASAMQAYVRGVANAGESDESQTVLQAVLAGYLVREAEHKLDMELRSERLTINASGRELAAVLGQAAFLTDAEISRLFAYHEAGWLAAQRWIFTHVSLHHWTRTGAGHNLDVLSATSFGYGLRRAAEGIG